MKISFSPDMTTSSWLGSKHQLTNLLTNPCTTWKGDIAVTAKSTVRRKWTKRSFRQQNFAQLYNSRIVAATADDISQHN